MQTIVLRGHDLRHDVGGLLVSSREDVCIDAEGHHRRAMAEPGGDDVNRKRLEQVCRVGVADVVEATGSDPCLAAKRPEPFGDALRLIGWPSSSQKMRSWSSKAFAASSRSTSCRARSQLAG